MSGHKTPRELAERLFIKATSPSATRDRALSQIDALKAENEEKMRRLREARLARDAQTIKKP